VYIMIRKISFLLILSLLLSVVILPSLQVAASTLKNDTFKYDLFKRAKVTNTKQFLLNINRPDGSESVNDSDYVISADTDAKDVIVQIGIYNDAKKQFVPFVDENDDNQWEIGKSGLFMKEIKLKETKNGVNRIRVYAYKKGAEKNFKLGYNLQINEFKITLLNDEVQNIISDESKRINDILGDY
jgi:hypothetical protein